MPNVITRTTKGDIAAHNNPGLVSASVYFQILAKGIIAGLLLAVVLAITAFAIVKANSSGSPGVAEPGPGAVASAPSDPVVSGSEVGRRGRQPDEPGDGLKISR